MRSLVRIFAHTLRGYGWNVKPTIGGGPALRAVLLAALTVGGCVNVQVSGEVGEVKVEPGDRIPVKVVIVTMFETGEDSGDKAGEFQRWN